MLLGVQDLSWLSMKKFLSNRGVKDDIMNYDVKRIDNELRKSVAKLLKKKPASFDDATITRVSVAAAPMAAWVKANLRYSLVIEKIEPLQRELEDEVRNLEMSQKRLKRCEDELQEIDVKIDQVRRIGRGVAAVVMVSSVVFLCEIIGLDLLVCICMTHALLLDVTCDR